MAEITELIGRIFDSRYQITEQIGRGGMGAVYKAVHLSMNQVVALKVLGKEMSADDKQVQRFYHEARASSRLKHPNTIKVFDFGRAEEGQLYLAMEYLEGQTLTQLLRRETAFPVTRAIKIARQITKSLAEAHMNGLVHRDLKPDNVFITHIHGEEDFVKVLDFGIAKFLEGNPEHERLTQAGLVCGTPLYISPEQALGRSLDGRSDLYSLGVILFEMVSGSPPFRADTPVALVMRHIHDAPPSLTEINPGIVIPRSLHELIFRLLDKDRGKRPVSAEELLQILESVLGEGVAVHELDTTFNTPLPSEIVKRGGNTRVETPMGDEDGEIIVAGPEDETQMFPRGPDGNPVDDEAPTAFIPQEDGEIVGNVGFDQEEFNEETIVLPSSPPEDEPIQVLVPSLEQPEPQPQPSPKVEKQAAWPWILFGIGSLALGGGMAAYGLGFFDTADPDSQPAVATVPEPAEPTGSAQPTAQEPSPPPPPPVRRTHDISLQTVPTGAGVEIDGKMIGKTPLYITIDENGESKTVVFKASGFRDTTVLLEPATIVNSTKTHFRYVLEQASEEPPRVQVKAETKAKKPKAKARVKSKKPRKPRKPAKPKAKPKPVLNWE